LHLVGTLGLGLVGKSCSQGVEVLIDLWSDLRWGEGFGQKASEVVYQVLLLVKFQTADAGEILASR
jgi:hypothetical protein